MIRRLHSLQIALFYCVTSSAQILWSEQSTHFDLHFEPIALIAVSKQEIQLSPEANTTAGSRAFTDSIATTFHLRYSISPVQPNTQLVHSVSVPDGLSSRCLTAPFLPASGTCTLAPSATHNETNQFLTTAIYGHSGTDPQNGIPVTVQISLSQSQYQNLDAHLHIFNLTYQCL
ncbi:hypothetical protein OAP05_06975 [Schleiferiaceae bacterium]|nr:hypothetical protein [Schleiferiaceae bacterium]